jgi:hypothetical protein
MMSAPFFPPEPPANPAGPVAAAIKPAATGSYRGDFGEFTP